MPIAESVGKSRAARDRSLLLVEQSRALHETARSLLYTCSLLSRSLECRERRGGPGGLEMVSVREPEAWRPFGTGETVVAEPVRPASLRSARPPSFELEGLIEDQPVRAAFEEGSLVCDPLLRRHAELVVALGDSFVYGQSGQSQPASLDGTPAVILATLMRAMRVTRVQVGM